MMMRRLCVAAMAVLVLGLAGCQGKKNAPAATVRPATVGQPEWKLLAVRTVDFRNVSDEFGVSNGGPFQELQIAVGGGQLQTTDLRLIFANGEYRDVLLQRTFGPNNPAHVVDTPGEQRKLKRVRLGYRQVGIGGGTVTVAVYGR